MSVVTVLTLLHWPMTNHVLFVPLFYKQNLNRANEEIAQVRTKAKAESAALHAGLRKEQMKVESLERALQQKVRRGVWPQGPGFLSSAAASLRWIWMKEASPFCPDTSIQFLSEPIQGGNKQGKPGNSQAHWWELSTGRAQRGSGINWTSGTKRCLVGS